MPKYIKKKDLKRAIDDCLWYHINKNGELVAGASTCDNDEPLYKFSDIINILYNLPTKKFKKQKHKRNKIKVGDIISYNENNGIVTYIKGNHMHVIWEDGSAGEFLDAEEWFKKTGRHYDIDSILEQLKGTDDEAN